jgi:regulator of sigma E protease
MTLIYFVLMLGIIVFIHELGHFFWAKKSGVYCYEFSLGFGPKLFSFRRKNDETLYALRLIPVGGYVSMAGEEIEEDDDVSGDKKLYNKKWYQKLIIILAGVINNFLLAFVVLFVTALIYGSYTTKPIIGTVVEDSASYKAGIEVGDRILKINDKKVRTWDDVTLKLALSNKKKAQTILVETKDKKQKTIKVKPEKIKDKEGNEYYSYGIALDDTKHKGLKNAITYACDKFISIMNSMVVTIKSLFTGAVGLGSLSGPVGIYSIVGEQSKAGLDGLLYLLAYLSINVGFINLIPFPAFDGYRALIIVIEKITGKKVNAKVDAIINTIGLFFLFALMIFITIKDILRLF